MSIAIDVDNVASVLLEDGWHEVADGSFSLDAYEFIWWSRPRQNERGGDNDPDVLHGGGQGGVCATGFDFTEKGWDGLRIAGPLTAILAVRFQR